MRILHPLGYLATAYLVAWGLTAAFVAPSVTQATMRFFGYTAPVDESNKARGYSHYVRVSALAPLVLDVEYDAHFGPVRGEGGRAIVLWLPWNQVVIREISSWSILT
jgi:hypothetical protein